MIKSLITVFLFILLPQYILASSTWEKSLVSGINLSQTGVKDWQQGGENALSWQANLQGKFTKKNQRYSWMNQFKLSYGAAKIGDESNRKVADEIYYNTVYTFIENKTWNPYLGASLLTQFSKSYNYKTSPKTEISDFFDPAFFTQSAGISVKPLQTLSIRSGLSLKETITNKHTNYSDDKRLKTDIGLELVCDYSKKLSEVSKLNSKLDIFSNLKSVHEIDYAWDTSLAVKATEFINVMLNLKLLYDQDVIDTQQVKSFMGLGLSYTLL